MDVAPSAQPNAGDGRTPESPPDIPSQPEPAASSGSSSDETSAAHPTGATTDSRIVRLRKWGQTVPGLLATTAVTTACATVVTVGVTGVSDLWQDTTPRVAVEGNPFKLTGFNGGRGLVQLLPRKTVDFTRPKDGCLGFRTWAKKRGGFDPGETLLQITISNPGKSPLVVTAFTAEVVSRAPAPKFTQFSCQTQGLANYFLLGMNLDAQQPHAEAAMEKGKPAIGYTVPAEGLETFLLTAKISNGTCRWKLTVHTIQDSQPQAITVVDEYGHPFATTAADPSHPATDTPVYTWDHGFPGKWDRYEESE